MRSFAQTQSGVSVVVDSAPDGTGGGGMIYRATGRYLAASDGARGGLRQQMGIGMGGPGAIQHLINIHFISPQVRLAGRTRQTGHAAEPRAAGVCASGAACSVSGHAL